MTSQSGKTSNTVYPLEELRQILNGKLKHIGGLRGVGSFSIDSRSLKQGDWFFCIRGERTDGHQYISEALERGAAGVVLDPSRIPEELCDSEFPRIEVADPNLALREWAAEARSRFGGKVLGITGSNGKTSTKEMLAVGGSCGPRGRARQLFELNGNGLFFFCLALPLPLFPL